MSVSHVNTSKLGNTTKLIASYKVRFIMKVCEFIHRIDDLTHFLLVAILENI